MSPSPSAFLRAIEDRFDDDTPRLVYADWLDEHGDPDRAAFIRLQCEADRLRAGRLDTEMPDADRLRVRDLVTAANDLRGRHEAEWTAGLPKWVTNYCWFDRGFVAVYTLTGRQLLADGAAVRRRLPLGGRLHVDRLSGCEAAVFGCEHLAAVTDLSLELAGLTDAGMRGLATSPHLGRVGKLSLDRNPLTDAAARALAASTALPALRELSLYNLRRLSVAGVRAVLESPNLAGLTALALSGGTNGMAVAAAFRSPAVRLTALTVLSLRHRRLKDVGAAALAESAALAQLVELNLAANGLTDAGAAVVLRSPQLRQVRRLELTDNLGVTDATARLILDDGRRWERVTLNNCSVSDRLQAEIDARCEAPP